MNALQKFVLRSKDPYTATEQEVRDLVDWIMVDDKDGEGDRTPADLRDVRALRDRAARYLADTSPERMRKDVEMLGLPPEVAENALLEQINTMTIQVRAYREDFKQVLEGLGAPKKDDKKTNGYVKDLRVFLKRTRDFE
jgi:hypothetical protein